MKRQLIAGFIILFILGCGLLPPPSLPSDSANSLPPENTENTAQSEQPPATTEPFVSSGGFTLTSPVMANGGKLPPTFTCDGQSLSPSLAWQNAPGFSSGSAQGRVYLYYSYSETAVYLPIVVKSDLWFIVKLKCSPVT